MSIRCRLDRVTPWKGWVILFILVPKKTRMIRMPLVCLMFCSVFAIFVYGFLCLCSSWWPGQQCTMCWLAGFHSSDSTDRKQTHRVRTQRVETDRVQTDGGQDGRGQLMHRVQTDEVQTDGVQIDRAHRERTDLSLSLSPSLSLSLMFPYIPFLYSLYISFIFLYIMTFKNLFLARSLSRASFFFRIPHAVLHLFVI